MIHSEEKEQGMLHLPDIGQTSVSISLQVISDRTIRSQL